MTSVECKDRNRSVALTEESETDLLVPVVMRLIQGNIRM